MVEKGTRNESGISESFSTCNLDHALLWVQVHDLFNARHELTMTGGEREPRGMMWAGSSRADAILWL